MELAPDTKNTFFHFLDGDIAISELEQWIYSNSSKLENELQSDNYLNLISFDFTQKAAGSWLRDEIFALIDRNEYYVWSTIKLLNEIIESDIDLVLAIRKLRELYDLTGGEWLPIRLGVGYESAMDHLPVPDEYDQWNKTALAEKLKEVEEYRDRIVNDAVSFLKTITEGN